jgi:hypothetical protein
MKRSFLLLSLLGFLFGSLTLAQAKDGEIEYHDIHLSGNRICRDCTWRMLEDGRVELINRDFERGIYEQSEILGVDNHPYWRKFLLHSYRKMGLPAQVILPFDREIRPKDAFTYP